MASVYEINKGVNRSVVFKGIKAHYIMYLAAGLVSLLLLFAVLFIAGINSYICTGIVLPLGAMLFIITQYLSKKYGEHGLMKKAAQKKLPVSIQASSRQTFVKLRREDYEES